MNLFDIIGPVMVGPSSSHTAGAAKIGLVARKLLGESIKSADILLYGSFLATGKGHGTGLALVAGLLGMQPDNINIPNSLELAREQGIRIHFGEAHLKNAHPNSVELILTGASGTRMDLIGESLGGSVINIASIDGMTANFSGDSPTLIIHNQDTPGCVAEVTDALAKHKVNIATLQLLRSSRGGNAVMIIEMDEEIPPEIVSRLEALAGIKKVTYYDPGIL